MVDTRGRRLGLAAAFAENVMTCFACCFQYIAAKVLLDKGLANRCGKGRLLVVGQDNDKRAEIGLGTVRGTSNVVEEWSESSQVT